MLGLAVSVLNLVGLFLTFLLLGGLGEWSRAQFIGVFGIFEVATAIAFVLCPNIWRLPVVEAEKEGPKDTQLAASIVFVPHWAGAAKAVAGAIMIAVAAWSEGIGPQTALIPGFALAVGAAVVAVSTLVARFGVARPDLDVVKITLARPGHKDLTLPGMSLSASGLQVLLGAFTIPVIQLLSPRSFYGPEVGPSEVVVAVTSAAAGAVVVAALVTWWGRLSLRAPAEQQRIAEESS